MSAAVSLIPTDRINRLQRELRGNYCDALFSRRKSVYSRIWGENPSYSATRKNALGLAAFLNEKELTVSPDDLLAGGQQRHDFEIPCLPEYHGSDSRQERILESFRRGYEIGLYCGALGGHVIAGYHRVLESGFGSMIDKGKARLELCTTDQRDFVEAYIIVCSAASEYARRYADRARAVAEETGDPEQVANLLRIAASCDHIATEPPRTFHEALQLLWITHEIITSEQSSGSLSLGRLDQLLDSYYERDRASGLLSREEAEELIDALWLKFAGLKRGFQNVTLAGSDGNGTDLTNDISHFCLRATRRLKMDQPLLSVRWHPGLPREFWAEVEALVAEGMGFPALFNEGVVIDAKKRVGVSAADAGNWGVVGCVEPTIPGKEFSHTEGLRVNWAKVLELMLNGGVCTVTGKSFPMHEKRELSRIEKFADFYRWYREELQSAIRLGICGMNILDTAFVDRTPYPFLSSTMEGCLEAGRDVTAGSTVYNFCTVNGLGMANAADSLTALEKTVFTDRHCTLEELAAAVYSDFEGSAALRQILKRCQKYGNDQPRPDTILSDLCDDFHETVTSHENGRGGKMQCGLYTVDSHGFMGERTGALTDGRRRGIALANALSPVQGSDTVGPTAVIKSCTKIDHRNAGNGMVLDLKFSPDFFAQIRAEGIFKSLVGTYFERGGMEIQFNVINRETLLKAKDRPEEYQNLVVRVSGFSAYFVDLPAVVQDEIIARTEYATV